MLLGVAQNIESKNLETVIKGYEGEKYRIVYYNKHDKNWYGKYDSFRQYTIEETRYITKARLEVIYE